MRTYIVFLVPFLLISAVGLALWVNSVRTEPSAQLSSQNNAMTDGASPQPSESPRENSAALSTPPVLSTADWQAHTDRTIGVTLKYPPDWEIVTLEPDYLLFKPKEYALAPEVEEQIPGVTASLGQETSAQALENLTAIYGSANQEEFKVSNLEVTHIWGTPSDGPAKGKAGGAFVVELLGGKALAFAYEVVDGRSYEPEARAMSQSLGTF